MIDAYKIGVKIALQGDLGAVINQVANEFERLDKAIKGTKSNIAGLTADTERFAAAAVSAAESWSRVASQIERAARAASKMPNGGSLSGLDAQAAAGIISNTGRRAGGGGGGGPPKSATPLAALVGAGAGAAAASPPASAMPQLGGRDITEIGPPTRYQIEGPGYTTRSDGFRLNGQPYYGTLVPSIPQEYRPYGWSGPERLALGYDQGPVLDGQIIPPGRGGSAGGPLGPRVSPMIDGTVNQPGYASYGPYGPPFGGGGAGGGGGGGNLPAVPGAAVPGAPGPRGPIPLNGIPPNMPGGFWPNPQRPLISHSETAAAGATAYFGLHWIEESLEKGFKFEDWMHRLAAQGFDNPDLQKQASEAAYNVQRNTRPTTLTGNLKLLSELQATVQSPKEALELLPEFASLEVQLSRIGDSNGASEMLAAIKAGEYKGVLSHKNPKTGEQEVDTEGLKKFVNGLVVSSAVTGGTVDPKQFLSFLRSSSYSGAMLSDPTLFARELALIQAMGASGAGRGLLGLVSQWGAGNMSEAAANLAIQMGIIQGGGTTKTNKNVQRAGLGSYKVLPGGFTMEAEKQLAESPDKFVLDYLMPHMQDYLRKRIPGYDKMSDEERARQEQYFGAGTMSSRQPGGRLFAEILRVKALMDRDEKAYEAALNRPLEQLLLDGNPVISAKGASASADALSTTIGRTAIQPAVDGLDSLTKSLNEISAWAKDHSEITRIGVEGLAAALAGMAAAGVIGLLLTLGGATGALAGLGAGIIVLYESVKKVSDYFGWAKASDPVLKDIKKDGTIVPWWMPALGTAHHEDGKHGFGGIGGNWLYHKIFGQEKPNAPMPDGPTAGRDDRPVPVHVTNPGDLVHGVAGGIANQSNRPPTGTMGHDLRIDLGSAYSGATNR